MLWDERQKLQLQGDHDTDASNMERVGAEDQQHVGEVRRSLPHLSAFSPGGCVIHQTFLSLPPLCRVLACLLIVGECKEPHGHVQYFSRRSL